jgi:large repetitive protein
VAALSSQMIGSNTYTEEGPSTITVTINDAGGAPVLTTTTAATTVDAPLTSSNGTTITGFEGSPTAGAAPGSLLGTFTDANQGATVADFTTAPGSVVVHWGDNKPDDTLGASNLTLTGSPNGVIFKVNAPHTYDEEGTYAYTVTVTDAGGAVTIFSGAAVIADAPLTPAATQPAVNTTEATLFPVPVFAPPKFKGEVASFNDANTGATTADFKAEIDWGDGTPLTAGTIGTLLGAPAGNFIVSGSHTYADAGVNGGTGTYAIQVFVVDDGGSILTVDNTANVADVPIVLTGMLNPATDTGLSTGTINVTSDKEPDFFGNSEPLSHITLSAALLPGGAPVVIGQVEAGSDGAWNIESRIALADGHYAITATATDQFGVTTTSAAAPAVIDSNLLIDTQGPVITGAFFNRINGQVDYTIQDPGGTPSGVWIASLLDSSNYELTKVHPEKNFPGRYFVSNVTVTPDPAIANAYDVAVQFNAGRTLRGGFYLFKIRDSSNGDASVQDLAENHLDGEFYGSFPSGNHINGGDFIAELQAYHNKVFAPQTIIGTANAANGGVGGNRVGAVHSGIFVPTIPRGGAPIFSTPTSPVTAAKKKALLKVKVKEAHSLTAHHASSAKRSLVVGQKHPAGAYGHS